MSLRELQQQLRTFAEDRDWEQFHSPKNLVMALSVEASELLELFQRLTPQQSEQVSRTEPSASRVREEMADVLAYLLRLADVLDIDLEQALHDKIKINAAKYPVEAARGVAVKYTELTDIGQTGTIADNATLTEEN